MSQLGRKGGSSKSEKKRKASQRTIKIALEARKKILAEKFDKQ